MIAVLPLLGGLLLGRFVANRGVAVGLQVAFFAIAAVVLIATAPDHAASHGEGALFAAVLAPISIATFVLGVAWRNRGTAPTSASMNPR